MMQKQSIYIIILLTLIVIVVDIALLLSGRATISDGMWVGATKTLFVPSFWGVIIGHWFVPWNIPKNYWRLAYWILGAYSIVVISVDVFVKIHLHDWSILFVFLVNILVGALLFPLERSHV